MKTKIFLLFFLILSFPSISQDILKVGVAGLTHGHVGWILDANKRADIEIVGIAEPNKALAERLTSQYGISMELVYEDLEDLLTETEPEAITAFGNIFDHLSVVEAAAPKGIHVMVEKPLAVSVAHAKRMAELAQKHQVYIVTNYETTWYPSVEKAQQLFSEGQIGEMNKLIVRDGHRGPKNIGINSEFLEWLTDPRLNGGGAIIDFGCYGANLSTWIQAGKRPNSVTAVTQQLQAENNPKVDDEATIILTYDDSQVILEPSWNWPIGRKDMEIYGETGAIYADNGKTLRIRMAEGYDGFAEELLTFEKREAPYDDPFTFFKALIREKIELSPYDLSSLENNLIVVEILEAAVKSSKTHKTVFLR